MYKYAGIFTKCKKYNRFALKRNRNAYQSYEKYGNYLTLSYLCFYVSRVQ